MSRTHNLIKCLLVIFLLSLINFTPAYAQNIYCVTGLSNQPPDNFLVLRNQPNRNSKWSQTINFKNGDRVEVLGTEGDFYMVRASNGEMGYSGKAYILPCETKNTPQSVQAVTQPMPAVWNHNNSTMEISVQGSNVKIYYLQPRQGLPTKSGAMLFHGVKQGTNISGIAYIFSEKCGPIPYDVSGTISGDQNTLTMFGKAPRRGPDCRVASYFDDTLNFNLIQGVSAFNIAEPKPTQSVQAAPQPQAAPQIVANNQAAEAEKRRKDAELEARNIEETKKRILEAENNKKPVQSDSVSVDGVKINSVNISKGTRSHKGCVGTVHNNKEETLGWYDIMKNLYPEILISNSEINCVFSSGTFSPGTKMEFYNESIEFFETFEGMRICKSGGACNTSGSVMIVSTKNGLNVSGMKKNSGDMTYYCLKDSQIKPVKCN